MKAQIASHQAMQKSKEENVFADRLKEQYDKNSALQKEIYELKTQMANLRGQQQASQN